MDRKLIYQALKKSGTSDYEVYLKTSNLFACQTDFSELCNGDELQFQIVHQVEELLMKLVVYTLLDIVECMQNNQTHKAVSLFKRVNASQNMILQMLDLLGTMSPKEYQEIRKKLGRGSGRDSPGFRAVLQMFPPLWDAYKTYYLEQNNLTIEQVYDYNFKHDDTYVIAECLMDFEILFQQFLAKHMQVIGRSIGGESKSLSGNDVRKLKARVDSKFFPELWRIRSEMTDRWGMEHGYVRNKINDE